MQQRPDGLSAEGDLQLLSDWEAEKQRAFNQEIKNKIAQHEKWNEGYMDITQAVLTSPTYPSVHSGFRAAVSEYELPTPPTSAHPSADGTAKWSVVQANKENLVNIPFRSCARDGPTEGAPLFRTRLGRGGRMIIDRRGMHSQFQGESDPVVAARFRYDDEDDEDEGPVIVKYDPNSPEGLKTRAMMSQGQQMFHQQIARRATLEPQPTAVPTALVPAMPQVNGVVG